MAGKYTGLACTQQGVPPPTKTGTRVGVAVYKPGTLPCSLPLGLSARHQRSKCPSGIECRGHYLLLFVAKNPSIQRSAQHYHTSKDCVNCFKGCS